MEAIFANFRNKPFFVQLLYLLLLLLFCYSLFSMAEVLLLLLAGFSPADMNNLVTNIDRQNIALLKILQLITTIGVFLVPALLFARLKNNSVAAYLRMQEGITFKTAALAAMVTVSALPVMAFVMEQNQSLSMPGFLKGLEYWMREMEDSAEKLTYAFLEMNSPLQLFINLLLIALLPALGEELLFRGCLQQLLTEWTQKPHKAIFITAALFSAIHFQFFGFVPRMLIGVFLGYLFYWSGNLWYAVLGHFINNALQVVVYYFTQTDIASSELKPVEALPASSVLFGTAVFGATLYLFYKNCHPQLPNTGKEHTIAG
ncbi:CPBP family intramembrane metalloprotease [Sphingobacteriales bacterium UPWRP_1]|nr:hypothetical protein B6N25_02355 [Sphingobacteriales bacterium TSM_CSS]PSJ75586.1 CPBP family intramembrane metalloprotease [Sphingobacteriales bacterium UPWRP_1]